MSFVAGPKLAQQALALTQIETLRGSDDRWGAVDREKRIRHVLETGKPYEDGRPTWMREHKR